MMDVSGNMLTDILQVITSRYVVNDRTIPADVLKLKDEAMDIYEKSRNETDSAVLEQYERRLAEIKETLEKA